MHSNQLLVTVNILSYNRKDELRNTLTKVYEQDYKNIEIIVVDNASSDGSPEMVMKEFPKVQLIQLEKNIGIAGWNEGFKVAKGEYILVLDDDSYPEKKAIINAIDCMLKHSENGALYLTVYNLYQKAVEGDYIDKNNPNMFIGCGALIKKKILESVGVYNEFLFLYEHEIEFAMRVYNNGYLIQYCKDTIIYHSNALSNRQILNNYDHRKIYYTSRNYIIVLFLHFSIVRLLIFIPQLIISRIVTSIIYGGIIPTFIGFYSGIRLLPKLVQKRLVLKKKVQKFYRYGNYMGRFVRDKRY
jgi:GT2 family glycosyltransferase